MASDANWPLIQIGEIDYDVMSEALKTKRHVPPYLSDEQCVRNTWIIYPESAKRLTDWMTQANETTTT